MVIQVRVTVRRWLGGGVMEREGERGRERERERATER
jgi:hypothetical protein